MVCRDDSAVKRRLFSVCENSLLNRSLLPDTFRVMKRELGSKNIPLETVTIGNLASRQAERRVNVDQASTRNGDRQILDHRNKSSTSARLGLEPNIPPVDPLPQVAEETQEVISHTLFIDLKTKSLKVHLPVPQRLRALSHGP